MAWIKVKWIKAHWDYAYSAGQVGIVDSSRAQKLLEGGFIIPLPDEQEEKKEVVNPLPGDLPGRAVLFDVGFTSLEQLKEAGDSLLDAGISGTTLKKINKYLAGK